MKARPELKNSAKVRELLLESVKRNLAIPVFACGL